MSFDKLADLRKQQERSVSAPPKALTSLADLEPEKCPYCAKTCRFFERTNGFPSFYAGTCGGTNCAQKWIDDHPGAIRGEHVAQGQPELAPDWTACGVAPLLAQHTLADFPDVKTPERPRHTFIYGPNGTGKSALSVALLKQWGGSPRECVWTSAYRILSRIKSTFRRKADESEANVMDELAAKNLLVIDDLGAENKTDFGISTLYEVVKERCEAGRTVIVTSNLTLPELDKLEPRLASRMAQFWLVPMKGVDRRIPT